MLVQHALVFHFLKSVDVVPFLNREGILRIEKDGRYLYREDYFPDSFFSTGIRS